MKVRTEQRVACQRLGVVKEAGPSLPSEVCCCHLPTERLKLAVLVKVTADSTLKGPLLLSSPRRPKEELSRVEGKWRVDEEGGKAPCGPLHLSAPLEEGLYLALAGCTEVTRCGC